MPKLPDFSKLAEKIDLHGFVESVKSIIKPEDIIPKDLEGDPIAAKLALIRASAEIIDKLFEQQKQELNKINALIASVYKDIAATKAPSEKSTTAKKTTTTSNLQAETKSKKAEGEQ
jgi:hypothetical protein